RRGRRTPAAVNGFLRIGAERTLHFNPSGVLVRKLRRYDCLGRGPAIGPVDEGGEDIVLSVICRRLRRNAERAIERVRTSAATAMHHAGRQEQSRIVRK